MKHVITVGFYQESSAVGCLGGSNVQQWSKFKQLVISQKNK